MSPRREHRRTAEQARRTERRQQAAERAAAMKALRDAAQGYLDEQRARNARWGRARRTS